MSLQALVLCSDDKVTRILRRVLSDLEIDVELCTDADSAVRKLTRRRFEAVVVDCNHENIAAQVLRSVRSAPCNKRSIAVAIIDGQKAVPSPFALGAHFVLYKPISAERARTNFRAARALMKCEHQRNMRVAVQIPVTLVSEPGARQQEAVTSDIGQGGMSIELPLRAQKSGPMSVKFTLPGTEHDIECAAEVAWEAGGQQAGIRFVDLSPEQHDQLKSWLVQHCPEIEPNDPPATCKLTDLSPSGCYLEMAAPFPVDTRVILYARTAKFENRAEGVVRAMHPEIGMGIEFNRTTDPQRKLLERFTHDLGHSNGVHPQFVVEPEGMNDVDPVNSKPLTLEEIEDPLLGLFRRTTELTVEAFRSELRMQRNPQHDPAETISA